MGCNLLGSGCVDVVVRDEEVSCFQLIKSRKMKRIHLEGREPCPLLPAVEGVWTARMMEAYRGRHDVLFYEAALGYAQSLWMEGKPAQALLQMNKAMMADLRGGADGPEDADGRTSGWMLPYAAKLWVMRMSPADEFMGNPVRHYQHLATRMSGVRSELRALRAWACFHLAESHLPTGSHPRDERQIVEEAVQVPPWQRVAAGLDRVGLSGERKMVERCF